jgi:hypothetical protein
MIFLIHIFFNWMGFVFALIAGGIAAIVAIALDKLGSSFFTITLWALHSGALVAGLLGVAYDRHDGMRLLRSYSRYIQELFAVREPHPGRIALCQVPLALYPVSLLFLFLFFWACGILISLTVAQAIQFLLVSILTISICAISQVLATSMEMPSDNR